MPLGMVFRKAVLWHEGRQHMFRKFSKVSEDRGDLQWKFRSASKDGCQLEVAFDGRGRAIHRLPYLKTGRSGTFEVANNSLANATVSLKLPGKATEKLETIGGAVLEMGGSG